MKLKKLLLFFGLALAMQACKKEEGLSPNVAETQPDFSASANLSSSSFNAIDPSLANTEGFFMNDSWMASNLAVTSVRNTNPVISPSSTTVTINPSQVISKVSRYVYGNNANANMGSIVDPTLVNHVKNLAPRLIRVPGGSFSDTYFWNLAPDQKPDDVPDQLYDPNGNVISAGGYWYGRNTQTWTCTIDNYYQMLQQTNSKGIITVNYGYARYGTGPNPVQTAAHMAAQWVRYDKGRTKYWEVGNECFGNWEAGYMIDVSKNQDGQPRIITGELYGQHFKVFADSMRNAAAEMGITIKVGAVMIDHQYTGSEEVPNWNQGVLATAGNSPDFYAVHNYYTPYGQNSTPSTILNSASTVTTDIMNWIKTCVAQAGVVQKPVALTEWNIFAQGSKQMISNVSGLHSAIVLGELIKNQYGVACRWDLGNNSSYENNDMGMLNVKATNTANDPKYNPRPAFYYMYFFQKFFGDRMVASTVQGNTNVVSYASTFTSGQVGVVLANKTSTDQIVSVKIDNYTPGTNYYFYRLKGGTDDRNFSTKVYINGIGPSGAQGGPLYYASIAPYCAPTNGDIKVSVPAYGAVFAVINKATTF
jgi:alpha-L-arabinofuranosidase